MNREQVMDAMNHIDPAMVEAADRRNSTVKHCHRGWSRSAVIAACLCLVFAGTALAWNSSRVQITWVDSDSEDWLKEHDAAYTVDRGLDYLPLECISEEITSLAAEFQNGTAAWSFASWAELEEYLGMNLFDNPVLDGAAPGPKTSYNGMKDKPTNILLTANFNGRGLVSVSADTSYVIDGVWVRSDAQIYTDLMREGVELYAEQNGKPAPGIVTGGDDVEVSMKEFYTTPSGLEAAITQRISNEFGPQLTWYMAHFSINEVRCDILAGAYPVGNAWENADPGHTLEVLKEVLDGFVYEPAV